MYEKEINLVKRALKRLNQFIITTNRKWKRRRINKDIDKIMKEDK